MTVVEMDTPNNPVFDPMAWLAQKPSATTHPRSSAPANTQPTKACQSLSHADENAGTPICVRSWDRVVPDGKERRCVVS